MNRKIKILLVVVIIIATLVTVSYGFGIDDLQGNSSIGTGSIETAGKRIVSIISSIGVVISVVVIAVLGIKYMLGSIEERAEYKRTLMPYFIGAILVFGASTIAQIVYQLVK